jgi:hypothetical protein
MRKLTSPKLGRLLASPQPESNTAQTNCVVLARGRELP